MMVNRELTLCKVSESLQFIQTDGTDQGKRQSLDKDQRQDRQYNYEQAISRRHAGWPADSWICSL